MTNPRTQDKELVAAGKAGPAFTRCPACGQTICADDCPEWQASHNNCRGDILVIGGVIPTRVRRTLATVDARVEEGRCE